MRQWGKRECRRRSGSPWRALGLIRSTNARCPRAARRTRGGGLRAAGAVVCRRCCRWRAAPAPRRASARYEFPTFDAYISALPLLDRDEIAALALTLRHPLASPSSPAILFVRTRRPAWPRSRRRRRDEAVASKAAGPTAPTRCFSPSRKSWWHGTRARRRARNHRRSHAGEPGGCQRCSPSVAGLRRTPPVTCIHAIGCVARGGGVGFASDGEHAWHRPGSPAWDRR